MAAPHAHTSRVDRALLLAVFAVLLLTIAYPCVRLLFSAVQQWDWTAVTGGKGLEATRNTLFIGLGSVLLSGAVGTGLALLIHHYRFPGRGLLAGLAYMPFTLPPLVGVLSFYYLIGKDGFLPRGLDACFGWENTSFDGAAAILLIHTYSFFVYFYAMVSAALEGLDDSLVQAARSLGASRSYAFIHVTLPLLKPALQGASLLTFMSSGASFSAPLFFGTGYPMLSVVIFEQKELHPAQALSLTVVLAIMSLLGIVLFRSRQSHREGGSKGTPRVVRSNAGKFLATSFSYGTIVFLLAPHATIVYLSFVNHREWYAEVLPHVFTLDNYARVFSTTSAYRPVINSLWMSGLAAIFTLLVALPAGYILGRKRTGATLLNILIMIPWALPGTVIAMNLITAFNDPWLPLYNTVYLLPLAYFVRNIPLLARMSTAAVAQIDPYVMEAARTLGASLPHALWRVALPLLAPALLAGTALVFATSLGEFVASILLYTPSNVPISVQIRFAFQGSGIGSAFAYSVMLMAMAGATFILARRFSTRLL